MATTVVVRTNISGTTFILDVTELELIPSLSTLDFEVTHNGVVNTSYAKTSQTQLTYTGANVVLGTKIVARRVTNVSAGETTFISTTTASELTNALTKLRRREEELDAYIRYTTATLAAGGITIGTIPISNVAYAASWAGDNTTAPSRNAVYNKLQADASSLTSALALKANLASPALTGVPTAPTAVITTNNTQLATTAFVVNQRFPILKLLRNGNTTIVNNTNTVAVFNSVVEDSASMYNAGSGQMIIPTAGRYLVSAVILLLVSASVASNFDARSEIFVNGVTTEMIGVANSSAMINTNIVTLSASLIMTIAAGATLDTRINVNHAGSGFGHAFVNRSSFNLCRLTA